VANKPRETYEILVYLGNLGIFYPNLVEKENKMFIPKNTKLNKRQTLASHINIPNLHLRKLVFPSVISSCLPCFLRAENYSLKFYGGR